MSISSVAELNKKIIKYDTGKCAENLLGFISELIGWSMNEENKETLDEFFMSYFGEKCLTDIKKRFNSYLSEEYLELLKTLDKHKKISLIMNKED